MKSTSVFIHDDNYHIIELDLVYIPRLALVGKTDLLTSSLQPNFVRGKTETQSEQG